MALKTRSTSRNTRRIDGGTAEVKVELTLEVAHLSLSAPVQQLRMSPRKRTASYLKEESDEECPPSSGLTSRFWPGGPSTSRRRATKEDSDNDDVLPTLPKTGSLGSAIAMERKQTVTPKRRATKPSGTPSPLKKVKRQYAPPETYAHLEYLSDYLQEHLDGMLTHRTPFLQYLTSFLSDVLRHQVSLSAPSFLRGFCEVLTYLHEVQDANPQRQVTTSLTSPTIFGVRSISPVCLHLYST